MGQIYAVWVDAEDLALVFYQRCCRERGLTEPEAFDSLSPEQQRRYLAMGEEAIKYLGALIRQSCKGCDLMDRLKIRQE